MASGRNPEAIHDVSLSWQAVHMVVGTGVAFSPRNRFSIRLAADCQTAVKRLAAHCRYMPRPACWKLCRLFGRPAMSAVRPSFAATPLPPRHRDAPLCMAACAIAPGALSGRRGQATIMPGNGLPPTAPSQRNLNFACMKPASKGRRNMRCMS